MRSFEEQYQAILEILRDSRPNLAAMNEIERRLARLNHSLTYADLDPDHRVELLRLRNETMTEVAAALHRAHIDDARAVARAIQAQRPTEEERRRHRRSGTQSIVATSMPRPPQQVRRDRGISR